MLISRFAIKKQSERNVNTLLLIIFTYFALKYAWFSVRKSLSYNTDLGSRTLSLQRHILQLLRVQLENKRALLLPNICLRFIHRFRNNEQKQQMAKHIKFGTIHSLFLKQTHRGKNKKEEEGKKRFLGYNARTSHHTLYMHTSIYGIHWLVFCAYTWMNSAPPKYHSIVGKKKSNTDTFPRVLSRSKVTVMGLL